MNVLTVSVYAAAYHDNFAGFKSWKLAPIIGIGAMDWANAACVNRFEVTIEKTKAISRGLLLNLGGVVGVEIRLAFMVDVSLGGELVRGYLKEEGPKRRMLRSATSSS